MRRAVSACVTLLAVGAVVQGPSPASAATAPRAAEVPVGGARLAGNGVIVTPHPAVPAPPAVPAASYLVADVRTGAVLAAKAPHARFRPASTMKLLTALTLHPRLPAKAVHRVVESEASVVGSRAGIVAGGTYTVHQLWQAVFTRSGNDATTALANHAGGAARTVSAMNATARRLGALDTTAVNVTGLDADGQLTSAYDLALIGRAALGVPALRRYAATVSAPFPGEPAPKGERRPTFQLWTQQRFVLDYEGGIGLKNGYTSLARNTLVAAATRGKRTVLVTILKDPRGAYLDAARLADWAFEHGPRTTPVGTLVVPPPAIKRPPPPPPRAAVPGRGSGGIVTQDPVAAVPAPGKPAPPPPTAPPLAAAPPAPPVAAAPPAPPVAVLSGGALAAGVLVTALWTYRRRRSR